MIRQHNASYGQVNSIAPKHLAQLHLKDDLFGDEFDWDESIGQYEGDMLASDMCGDLADFDTN